MLCFRSYAQLFFARLTLFLLPFAVLVDHPASAVPPELAIADQLYRSGKFAEAEASYQALVKTDSKLEIQLDYRDGLVDFRYDPKRVNPFSR